MLIIPAIDIKDGRCIRLLKGDFSKKILYSFEPLEIALEFERNGSEWIHIVDIDGALKGEFSNWEIVNKIRKNVKSKIQLGGGINSIPIIEKLINIGVERIILSSVVFKNKKLFEEILKNYREKIIVSLDVMKGKVRIRGWKEESECIESAISYLAELGIYEFIFTDIERDGTMEGVRVEKIEDIISKGFEIYFAGGVRDEKDIEILKLQKGLKGVIVGRAIYEGRIEMKFRR